MNSANKLGEQSGKTREISSQTNWRYQGNVQHAKMKTLIKGRNGKDLTEARIREEVARIRKIALKMSLHIGYYNGVVTHLRLNILECEVK